MEVSVIGAGRVGTAIAVLLQRAGHRIATVSGRDDTPDRAATYLPEVPIVEHPAAARSAEVVLVGVPDDAIEDIVERVAAEGGFRSGQWVGHLSGATPLGALDAAARAGAGRFSMHPLQAVADVPSGIARIPRSAIAVSADDAEGVALGERLSSDIGGEPFVLAEPDRALYHAAAVFASNFLVAVSGQAETLFELAGVPEPLRAMLPLQHGTLENVERLGVAGALTGPAARGDAGTVERNLEALGERAPDAIPAYVVLCRAALDIAAASGRPSDAGRHGVEEVLARWT